MMPALREGAARAQKQATVMVSSGRVTGNGVVAKNPNFCGRHLCMFLTSTELQVFVLPSYFAKLMEQIFGL